MLPVRANAFVPLREAHAPAARGRRRARGSRRLAERIAGRPRRAGNSPGRRPATIVVDNYLLKKSLNGTDFVRLLLDPGKGVQSPHLAHKGEIFFESDFGQSKAK